MKHKILSLLTLLVVCVTGVWAEETLFSATAITSDNVSVAASTTDQVISASQATITGGSMYVSNGENDAKTLISKSAGPSGSKKAAFALTNSKTIFKIVLSQALAAGDVIEASIYPNSGADGNGLWFSTSSSRPSDAPSTKATTSSVSAWTTVSYTIVASDGLCGKTTFYVYRGTSTTTNYTGLTITRPTIETYTVTYKANEGIGSDVVDDDATEIEDNTFEAPSGKAFAGWNTKSDGTGDSYDVGDDVIKDLTLYAQWADVYAVSFNLQGHGSDIEAQNIISGGKVTEPAEPSASGYIFGGWFKEAGCENEWDFDEDVVNTTTTLYAKWTEFVCPSSGTVFALTMKSATLSSVTQNNEVNLVPTYASTTNGKAYLGNKNADAGKAQVKTDGSGTIYFSGNDAYIKIVLDCALQENDVISIINGSGTKEVSFTKNTTRATTYSTSSQSWTVSAEFLGDDDVSTIYVWRYDGSTYLHSLTITRPEKFTVTYKANGGIGGDVVDDDATEIEDNTFEAPSGKAFAGWNTKSDGTGDSYDVGDGVIKDLTLYAQWATIYTISKGAHVNGDFTISPASCIAGTTISLVATPNDGYVFSSWQVINSSTEADVTASVSIGNVNSSSTSFIMPAYGVIVNAIFAEWVEPNIYYYKDAEHYVESTYKNPEGETATGSNDVALSSPWTICDECVIGVTSVIATGCQYDNKSNHMNAYIKVPTGGDKDSKNISFTIADGYKAVLKIKMGGFSSNPSVTLKKFTAGSLGDNIAFSGTISGVATIEDNFNELSWTLPSAGTYVLNVTSKNAYISQIDIQTSLDVVSVSTLDGRNYGTMVTPAGKKLDFSTVSEDVTAYIALGLNSGSDAVRISSIDVVPENTPIIVKTTTKGATVSVPVTTSEASSTSGNLLIAGDGSTLYSAGTYYFMKEDEFHLAISGTLQTGKAYLQISGPLAPGLLRIVEEEQNATNIENLDSTDNIVKLLENGQLLIMKNGVVYDVLGRVIR